MPAKKIPFPPVTSPDLATVSIAFSVVRRTRDHVTIRVTGTVQNIGGTGIFTGPGPIGTLRPVTVSLFEGETRRGSIKVAETAVRGVTAGATITLTHDRAWSIGTEFFPNYYLEVIGRDARADNNKLEKAGQYEIARLIYG
jgi:hypothetical protein